MVQKAELRSLLIGLDQSGFRSGEVLSSINLKEFSTIIWDYSSFHAELMAVGWRPDKLQHDSIRMTFETTIRPRLQEMAEWVENGNCLVLFWEQPPLIQIDIAGKVRKLDLNTYFPFEGRIVVECVTGRIVDY